MSTILNFNPNIGVNAFQDSTPYHFRPIGSLLTDRFLADSSFTTATGKIGTPSTLLHNRVFDSHVVSLASGSTQLDPTDDNGTSSSWLAPGAAGAILFGLIAFHLIRRSVTPTCRSFDDFLKWQKRFDSSLNPKRPQFLEALDKAFNKLPSDQREDFAYQASIWGSRRFSLSSTGSVICGPAALKNYANRYATDLISYEEIVDKIGDGREVFNKTANFLSPQEAFALFDRLFDTTSKAANNTGLSRVPIYKGDIEVPSGTQFLSDGRYVLGGLQDMVFLFPRMAEPDRLRAFLKLAFVIDDWTGKMAVNSIITNVFRSSFQKAAESLDDKSALSALQDLEKVPAQRIVYWPIQWMDGRRHGEECYMSPTPLEAVKQQMQKSHARL